MSRIMICLVAILFVLPAIISCSAVESKIAVISLNGPIMEGSQSSLFGGRVITPESVRNDLLRARDDASVKAVVIQVDSPGGQVSACQEIVYEMDQFKKPVVMSLRGIAASGGYYISAKANRILALPSTLTGSIGVISEIPNLKGLFDKIGIKIEVIKAGKYKDMFSGTRDFTPEEVQIMQTITDESYDQFISVVAEGRHMEKEKVRELATGQLYTGAQAKALGLVDELGGLQAAIDSAAKLAGIESPRVEYYQAESPGLLKLLFSLGDGKLGNLTGGGLMTAETIVLMEFMEKPYPRFLYR